MRCKLCGREFGIEEYTNHSDALREILKHNKAWDIVSAYCPDCIGSVAPIIQNPIARNSIAQYSPARNFNLSDDMRAEIQKKTLATISGAIAVISILVLLYSLMFKFSPFNLPPFPFYPYIIAFSCFIFLVYPRKIVPINLIIALLNFMSPAFRNIFFSYFDKPVWAIFWTILFILSNMSAYITISSYVAGRNFIQSKISSSNQAEKLKGLYMSLFLGLTLYFGLVSPFHLKVIKPKVFKGIVAPVVPAVDKLYTEIKREADKEVDRRIAYQYLEEGKASAGKGTYAGFKDSIQSYQRALELIPDFSTAYAEMAYSYVSMARILTWDNSEKKAAQENRERAKEAIQKASRLEPENPIVWGIDAILDVYQNNRKTALQKFRKAEQLANEKGFSGRVLQAKAILTRKYDEKLSLLIALNEKVEPNNAELFNLLGLAYYDLNDKKSSRKMFERAITLSPNYGEAILNLALVSPPGKRYALWREAGAKDEYLKHTADNYIVVTGLQKWLCWVYAIILAFSFLAFIQVSAKYVNANNVLQANQEYTRALWGVWSLFVKTFIITYLFYYTLYFSCFIDKGSSIWSVICFLPWAVFIGIILLSVFWPRGRQFYFIKLLLVGGVLFTVYKIGTHLYPSSLNTLTHRFPSLFPFF